MASVETGPLLKGDDSIAFAEAHRPRLKDGDYEVFLTHDVSIRNEGFKAKRNLAFAVAGPRCTLPPGEIASCFPPRHASGEFTQVLPHVILSRASLPWERTALPVDSGVSDDEASPWLALLVFSEDEISSRTKIVTAADLTATPGIKSFAPLPKESTDDPDVPVCVIDLPHSLAVDILPTIGELELLTSVREVNGKDSRAIVVANRLCKPGVRHIAHLVSLEGQYRKLNGIPANAKRREKFAHWSSHISTARSMTQVRLVSLASWTFHCDTSRGDFGKVLEGVTPVRLALDAEGLTTTRDAVEAGAVPLAHQRLSGDRTASWYHGPLASVPMDVSMHFPVRKSEDLLRVDTNTGLVDVSYASAWELGRLLALADPKVGPPLYQWKRRIHHAARIRSMQRDVRGVRLAHHAPGPFPLSDWFANTLGKLAAVPFDYLVPDPALLPPESIAFFQIDDNWIAALYDGAFSIGRTGQLQRALDARQSAELQLPPQRSGLILRSSVVDGWPDLIVDGFDVNGLGLGAPVRFERLGKSVLLVLFDGALVRAEIHLHPQAMHFGYGPHHNHVATVPLRDEHTRVITICDLELNGLAKDHGISTAHDFALRMIDPVPKVIFEMEAPA